MIPLTTAQQIYIALGVDQFRILLAHKSNRMPSHTKKGPGRFHKQGKIKKAN